MAVNLDVDHFRNGDRIPEAKTKEEWKYAGERGLPAWCYYDNDPANGRVYGKLYNIYAVNDPRGLAPEGWHMTSDREWDVLMDYLFGTEVAGGKLKETGTTHWQSPNHGATNESSFSALPGGYRVSDGAFYDLGIRAIFW
jgi:uncharacterized protein (TIGR02145 family)